MRPGPKWFPRCLIHGSEPWSNATSTKSDPFDLDNVVLRPRARKSACAANPPRIPPHAEDPYGRLTKPDGERFGHDTSNTCTPSGLTESGGST